MAGSSGIGAGVAKLAFEKGLRVAIASSNPRRVKKAIENIRNDVPEARVSGYVCDLNTSNVETHGTVRTHVSHGEKRSSHTSMPEDQLPSI